MNNYDAIFWDFDGVICDSVNIKTEAFSDMFEQYGTEIQKKVVDFHLQNGGVSRFEKFRHFYENFLNQSITQSQIDNLAKDFSDLVMSKVLASDYIDGAIETLEKFHEKNTPMFVISGTPDDEIKNIVKERNLSKYFLDVKGSPKKKIELVKEIFDISNYNNKNCIFIGDALSDYDCAIHYGMDFLGIKIPSCKTQFPENTKVQSKVYLL